MTGKTPDPDAILALQDWIRLLTEQGAPMRSVMALAAKAYKDTNTRAKLTALSSQKISSLVPDKETRKAITNAIKGISLGQSPQKKRRRDDDLLRPLGVVHPDIPESFAFNEIRDVETLLAVSVTVNRAPVKTAWAYVVARRAGFDVEESLSLAHVYVHIGSLKHALALGNILNAAETRAAEEEIRELPGESAYHVPGSSRKKEVVEKSVGSSQPWVHLLKSKPVIERLDGTWRAIEKGVAVEPSVAYLYITRALKTFTPHVMGAMQLVAESYSPEELEVVGLALYNEFKPDVVNWGQRGEVSIAKILDQIKEPIKLVDDQVDAQDDAAESSTTQQPSTEIQPSTPQKRKADQRDTTPDAEAETPSSKKAMTVEEYEAMLDDEFDEALYAF